MGFFVQLVFVLCFYETAFAHIIFFHRRKMSDQSGSEKKYCLNVTIWVKPERREEFLACIKQNQTGTLSTEPLVRGYTWGESTSEPNTFYFQEQFASEEGFIAHTQTPHFAVWKEFADSDPFTKPPEVKFFREV
jgi:quinol monooxygenase YgiN